MSIVVLTAPASRRHHALGVRTPWVQWCLRYADLIGAEAVYAIGVDGRLVARGDLSMAALEGAPPVDRRMWKHTLVPRLHEVFGADLTHATGTLLACGTTGTTLAKLLPAMQAPLRDLPAAEQRAWPEMEARRLQAALPRADIDAATFRAIGHVLRATGAATADAIDTTAWEALLSRIHDLATWNERIANGHKPVPRPPDLDAQVRVTVEAILRSGDVYRPQPHRDVAVLKKRLAANVTWVPNLCVDWDAEINQWNVQDVFFSRFRYRGYRADGGSDGWFCAPCDDGAELLRRLKG